MREVIITRNRWAEFEALPDPAPATFYCRFCSSISFFLFKTKSWYYSYDALKAG